MKTCYEITDLAFLIKVEQYTNARFRVTYGKQVSAYLTYDRACSEFGRCVFHALAYDGGLDNS